MHGRIVLDTLHRRRAASAAFFTLALASPAVAQAPAVAPRPTPLVDALAALDPGAVVRLRVGRHTIEGTYARDTPSCLVLRDALVPDGLTLDPCADDDGDGFFVPAAAVARIQEQGSGAAQGAKIGALIGAAGGILFGGLLAVGYQVDFGEGAEVVLTLGAIGAGGGALAGAGIGMPFEHWYTRYP